MLIEPNPTENFKKMKVPCNFDKGLLAEIGTPLDDRLTSFLLKQLEFYFSDANLTNDKFMRDRISENKKGFVQLSIFLKFNRIKTLLKQFQVECNQHIQTIALALMESSFLKMNNQQNMVKRIDKFDAKILEDPHCINEANERSIYVDSFCHELKEEHLYTIFSECGDILCINLPKYKSGLNLGYAFIEFSERAGASHALKLNNKVSKHQLSFNKISNDPLRVLSKSKWIELKIKLKEVI
jgi:La-related protein 7